MCVCVYYVQGFCTLQLLKAAGSVQRRGAVLDWILALVAESSAVQRPPSHPGAAFIAAEGLRPLFELLDLPDTQGLVFEDFWDLLQRLGEEQGALPLEDPELDGLVPVESLRLFLDQMLDGMVRSIATILTLSDIG